MKSRLILTVIVILAFILRFWGLSSNPPHLNWDEVSIGYNAYSVLETGKDEWGMTFPSIFRAYGDYKLPIYLYSTIPFIALFGLNEVGVRIVSVLAGVATVFFSYLLTKLIFRKENIGLLTAFLVAISPWDLFFSRIALEANLALALIISGVYFLFRKNYLIASLFLGLSVWTYNSARVFIPLLLLVYIAVFREELFKNFKKLKYSVLILSVFLLPMFWQLANQAGSARYENVKILDEGAISQIIENRRASKYNYIITRIIYNRPVYFTKEFIQNYLSHYSLDFLFVNGGDHYQFNLPNHGLLYEIDFIFIIFGITVLCFRLASSFPRRRESIFIILWFLVAPIASSLTREAPHALRNIVFLPLPMLFSAVGLNFVLENFKKYRYLFACLYLVLITLMATSYINNYLVNYTKDYSWAWQYGYSDAVNYITDNYQDYEKIIFTKKYGEPHEFLLFYGSKAGQEWVTPANLHRDPNLNRFYQSNWYWVDSFDKFYFVNDWEIPKTNEQPFVLESEKKMDLSGKVLFVTSPGNYPPRFVKLKEIYFLDGTKAFDIVTAEL